MAGAGSKLFVAGDVLTAAQVNTYLMDQSVMKFADAATRNAAFGGVGEATLSEGMMCYLVDTDQVLFYSGSAWTSVGSSADDTQPILSSQVFG